MTRKKRFFFVKILFLFKGVTIWLAPSFFIIILKNYNKITKVRKNIHKVEVTRSGVNLWEDGYLKDLN